MTDVVPTRWAPLVPPADPRAAGQPHLLALAAFRRRVEGRLGDGDPGFAERMADRTAAISGVGPEALEILQRPLSVPMLQDLHVFATRDQTAARAVTADGGFKYVPFPYGKLKDRPNSLISHGRVVCEFCPPERVVAELQVMLDTAARIPGDLPEVRAAWLVHALLAVHPFVDGNGRVSRLLASQPLLEAGLPPIWGELSDRGGGWKEAVAETARTNDLGHVAAVLAGHEERLVQRLLLDAESPGREDDLDAILAHDARLVAAREAWRDHAATSAAALPSLLDEATEALGALGARLDPGAAVERLLGASARREAVDALGEAGAPIDRRADAGLVRLDLPGRKATVLVGLAPVGGSGSGALTASMAVRPRAALATSIRPLLLVPEEDAAHRRARFRSWLDQGVPHAAANVVRLS